jgi:hypothetical protein
VADQPAVRQHRLGPGPSPEFRRTERRGDRAAERGAVERKATRRPGERATRRPGDPATELGGIRRGGNRGHYRRRPQAFPHPGNSPPTPLVSVHSLAILDLHVSRETRSPAEPAPAAQGSAGHSTGIQLHRSPAEPVSAKPRFTKQCRPAQRETHATRVDRDLRSRVKIHLMILRADDDLSTTASKAGCNPAFLRCHSQLPTIRHRNRSQRPSFHRTPG